MKKEIVKCDFCERELDRDKDSHYFEVNVLDMPGWASFSWPHPEGLKKTLQVCVACLFVKIKGAVCKDKIVLFDKEI